MTETGDQQSANELVTSSIPWLLSEMGCPLTPSIIEAVGRCAAPVRIAAGEVLMADGDIADAAFFVVAGRLEVSVPDDAGEWQIVRQVGRGEMVGEVGLIHGGDRTATVRADRDTLLARLSRDDFESIAEEHPGFLLGVTRTVVRRLVNPTPVAKRTGTVAVAVPHPHLDVRILTTRLLTTMQENGPSVHVSAAAVSAATSGAAGELKPLRAAAYLDTVEAENRFVLLETDRSTTDWTIAALRRADRTLIVISPDPEGAEHDAALALAAAARRAHRSEVWLAVVRSKDDPPPSGTAALLDRYSADRALHVEAGAKADMDRLARLLTGTGVGLVLGGGGARGFAHLGVFKALVEQGVPIDAVAGSSIGGILGAAIASGRSPDAATKDAAKAFRKVLDYTIPLVALVKGQQITKAINSVFRGVDIEDLPIPFLCVSTDLTSSKLLVHDRGSVTKWTRAGLAIPGVIPPVPHDGHLLVDGGVLDNLPVGPLRASGMVGTVIAVDLAPPDGPKARRDYGLSVSGWLALRTKFGRKKRSLPGISALLMRTMIVASMQQRDRQLAAGMADLVLRPTLRGVSLLAFDQVEPVAKAGYEAVAPTIAEWVQSIYRPGGVPGVASNDS